MMNDDQNKSSSVGAANPLSHSMKMIRPSLLRPVLLQQPQRRMAGGFPPTMRAKKNKFVEEWNGLRETTELKFEVDQGMLPSIITMCFLIPAGVYVWTKGEFQSKGDRRYEKTC